MKSAFDKVFEIVNKYLEDEIHHPESSFKTPEKLFSEINLHIKTSGVEEDTLFRLLEQITLNSPKTATKSFYNQLFGGRIDIGTAAEMLRVLLNNSMYTYKAAGIHILIEKEVIGKMLQRVGYEDGEGVFAPGGSLSNLVAQVIARNHAEETLRNEGFNGTKLTTYVNKEGHYSIKKNAGMLGMGRHNVREIACDAQGRMLPDALETQIQQDIKDGHLPTIVIATSGTTVLGAFDPIRPLAAIAKKYNMWFHIDAAYGGSVLLSDRYKYLIDGSELSDSFTWDSHKMMGVPVPASVILVKQKGTLYSNFSEHAEYLFQADVDDVNPGEMSIQCGRQNDALKVWAAWKYLGDEGFAARVDKQFALRDYAVSIINNDPDLELIVEPEGANVCFNVKGFSGADVCEVLDKEGMIKVSYGKFQGVKFVRLVCVNAELTFEDMDYFFSQVKRAAGLLKLQTV